MSTTWERKVRFSTFKNMDLWVKIITVKLNEESMDYNVHKQIHNLVLT